MYQVLLFKFKRHLCKGSIGFQTFGHDQVTNRIGNTQSLVINRVRVLRSGPHTPPKFSGSTPREFSTLGTKRFMFLKSIHSRRYHVAIHLFPTCCAMFFA